MNLQRLLLFGVVAISMGLWASEEAEAQWRTRYVRRDGLFHVEKYRTGNGITPAFANVLSTAIIAAPDIITSLQGRDIDEDSRQRSRAVNDEWRREYAEQQRLANELLIRTASLVNADVGTPGPGPPPKPGSDIGVQTDEEESGKNPWKPF